MADSRTANLGLHITPAEDKTELFIDWRSKINGNTSDSNVNIIDKAFGELPGQYVRAESGKVLSTNDYTNADKAQLATNTNDIVVLNNGKEPIIPIGTSSQYRRGDKTWQDFASTVRTSILTGLTTATNTAIVASDNILSAMGKLQAQINTRMVATNIKAGTNVTLGVSGNDVTINATGGSTINYESSTANIKANGVAAVGSLNTVPRADHVHPTDTVLKALADEAQQTSMSASLSASEAHGMADSAYHLAENANSAATTKEPKITVGTTSQYWRGDKTWQDLAAAARSAVLTGLSTTTHAVVVATDTTLTAIGKLQAQASSTSATASSALTAANNREERIPMGTSSQYYRGDKTWQDLSAAVRYVVLAGLSTATNTAINVSDTVLSAMAKLQAQINARLLPGNIKGGLGVSVSVSGNDVTIGANSDTILTVLSFENSGGTFQPNRPSGDAGVAPTVPRADHVHPSDTTRVPLSGGTMTGNLYAVASTTDYTTYRMRNISLAPSAPSTVPNGAIVMVYI